MSHVLQALTDLDPSATVLSVDGVGAFDLVSRASMLRGLQGVEGGGSVLPFVRQFHGGPSFFLWDDASGNTHHPAGRRRRTRRSLDARFQLTGPTPSIGNRGPPSSSYRAALAFFDDLYVVCQPRRLMDVHHIVAVELWSHAKIRLWNRGGVEPPEIALLQAAAEATDPDALVWKGNAALPEVEQGIKILGTPLGHPAYVQSFLRAKTEDHALLLRRILEVPDLQSAWLILLFCASTRANYLLRALPPCVTQEFAANHDESSRACLTNFVGQSIARRQMGVGQCAPQPRGLGSSQRFPDEACGTLGQLGGLLGDGERPGTLQLRQ